MIICVSEQKAITSVGYSTDVDTTKNDFYTGIMKQLIGTTVAIVTISILIGVGGWWMSFGSSEAERDGAAARERETTTQEQDATSTSPSSAQEISLPPITHATRTVPVDDREASFRIADSLELSVAADGLGKARFMAMSPDDRLFVPDLVDYQLSPGGRLYVLSDFDETEGRFQQKDVYLDDLTGANDIAFYTDESEQTWLYVATTAQLVRYPYETGAASPAGPAEVITQFPAEQAKSANSVVWHITRTIDLRDGRLYVSVGSGCNACEQENGAMRGMIYSMAPDGTDKRVYADGLRNAVGFTWAQLPGATSTALYATENGVDHLGDGEPNDVMYQLTKGEHYGWPYCYESDGETRKDTTRNWSTDYSCEEVPEPFTSFAPHTAPLGVEYFERGPDVLEGAFLVALHGSFEPRLGNGYKVVRVAPDGERTVLMDGFLEMEPEITRYGRPVDFLQYDENSFFFTDDYHGRIYYVEER